jgi:hypothetical protein
MAGTNDQPPSLGVVQRQAFRQKPPQLRSCFAGRLAAERLLAEQVRFPGDGRKPASNCLHTGRTANTALRAEVGALHKERMEPAALPTWLYPPLPQRTTCPHLTEEMVSSIANSHTG